MIAVEKAIINPEHEKLFDTLINLGYQTNILDATKCTPLQIAATTRNKKIVKKLLATGILKVDKHHFDHDTTLFISIQNGHLDVAELLLTIGANINIQPFLSKI